MARQKSFVDKRGYQRPDKSFTKLIAEALQSNKNPILLFDIYSYIAHNYPYFDRNQTGWKVPVSISGVKYAWKLRQEQDQRCEESKTFSPKRIKISNLAPITPETDDESETKLQWTTIPEDPGSESSSDILQGISPHPLFTATPKQYCTVGVQTDPVQYSLPFPKDPLSDHAGLPPIILPEDILLSQGSSIFSTFNDDTLHWSI